MGTLGEAAEDDALDLRRHLHFGINSLERRRGLRIVSWISCKVGPENGRWPVRSSYRMTPTE
jgi:hypothetical protein